MSVSGLTNQYTPATLDGLNVIEADQIYIDGKVIDLDNLVKYNGNDKPLNMGPYAVQSSHVPSSANDLVNYTTLVSAISNQDTTNTTTFLDKITSTPQTVQASTTFLNGLQVSDNRSTNLSSKVIVDANYQNLITSANVSVSQNFGAISSVPPVYQATTDTASGSPILIGFPIVSGKRYRFTIEMLVEDPTYGWYVEFLQSADNITPITGGIIDVYLLPTGSTAYTASDHTFVALTTGSVIIQTTTDGPPGNDQAVKWKNLTVYEMGVSLENASYPSLSADRVPIINEKHQLVASGINSTKLGYLDNVSSDIQTQLNARVLKAGDTMTGALTVDATVSVGYRLLGTPDGSSNFWIGLRGTGSETDRLAIDIVGDATTGVVSSVIMSKPLNMGANKITTTYTPVNGEDLITKTYADSTYLSSGTGYLPLTGGTMTGTLDMGANKITTTYTPVNGEDLITKTYADSTYLSSGTGYLPLTGGTLTGALAVQDTVSIAIAGLTPTTTPCLNLTSTGNHYNGSASQTYLFNAPSGEIQLSYSTTRNATTATLLLGAPSTDISEIVSVSGDGTTALPMNFSASLYSFLTGNVGIGTTDPRDRLHVQKNNAYASRATNPLPSNIIASSSSQRLYMGSYYTGGAGSASTIQSSDYFTDPDSVARDHGGPLLLNPLGGSVGVGTDAPQGNLHVRLPTAVNDYWGKLIVKTTSYWGDGCSSRSETAGTQYATMFPMMFLNPHIVSSDDGWCQIRMGRSGGVGTGRWWEMATRADGFFQIGVERSNQISINPNGNVGIGKDPVDKLEVNGGLRANGAIYAVNQGAGETYAIMYLTNNVGGCYWFLNSSTRTGDGGSSTCTLRNDTGRMRLQASGGYGLQVYPNGAVGIEGAVPYAIPSGYMARGSLTIGSCDQNYGGGTSFWNASTAGLLMECLTATEIAVHDAGHRVASLMYYVGDSANVITIGRNMGYGTTPVNIVSNLSVGGKVSAGTTYSIMNMGCSGSTAGDPRNGWDENHSGLLITSVPNQLSTSAGLALLHGVNGVDQSWILSLAPNVAWLPMLIYGAQLSVYYFGTFACYTTSGGWVNVSDEREKEDIQDIKTCSSLKRVLALRPKHYRRKYYDEKTPVPDEVKQRRCIGFLAQQVKETNPHCVSEWENKEAKCDEDDGKRMGICYNDYVVHLVGAVQEVVKRLDVLTTSTQEQQKMLKAQTAMIEVLQKREEVWVQHAKEQEATIKEQQEKVKKLEANIEKLAGLVSQLISSK